MYTRTLGRFGRNGNNLMISILTGFIVIWMAIWTVALPARAENWPVVRPLLAVRTIKHLETHGSGTSFVAFIKNTQGDPVYKLECRNGNYTDTSEIDFSGAFQCALFAVHGSSVTSGNLLAADTKNELSTDWWNRGRMRSTQLRGKCLQYPEYSTDRHFELRAMRLTLRFTSMKWSRSNPQQGPPQLSGFKFTFKVAPDKSVKSSRAQVPASPKPPKGCYP